MKFRFFECEEGGMSEDWAVSPENVLQILAKQRYPASIEIQNKAYEWAKTAKPGQCFEDWGNGVIVAVLAS